MTVHNSNGNAHHANSNLIPPVLPLRTLFKTKELKINETLITPSSNEAHLQSWISFITREVPSGYKDSAAVNLCYPDTAGHINAITADNPQARLRHALINNANAVVIDTIDVAGFNEGGSEIYFPSAFKLDLKYTRANRAVVCTGGDHANIAIADLKLSLKDMKISIPVFKPKEQLTSTLNKMFVDQDKDAKYYTTIYRTTVSLVQTGRRSIRESDIFNGSVPVRLYILYSARAN